MNSSLKLSVVGYEKVSLQNQLTDKEIRALVKNETQLPVRRLDTFTLISLLTVHRLFNNDDINTNTAIEIKDKNSFETVQQSSQFSLYSAAEYLSVDLFQSVLTDMHNNDSIRPFDFIATVGNAANFYIAKEFSIKGPNVFIGASDNAFLKCCALAEVDFLEGNSQQGIIIVWHLSENTRQCYAFIVESIEESAADLAVFSEKGVDIDALIKQDLAIPIPSIIQTIF